jgi:hypothetical protein
MTDMWIRARRRFAADSTADSTADSAQGTSVWDVLLLWAGTRLGLLVAATVGLGLISQGQQLPRFLDRWSHWDSALLIEIAQHGYGGNPAESPDPGLPAFFPGMPLALRLVHFAVPDWILSGLLISLVAGAVAMVALARLGDLEGGPGTGRWAVLALLLCPTAIFLLAGYSEPLFLAFAIPAWLAARRGHWPAAALLAAGASFVRITGLFLALALIVEYIAPRPVTAAEPARLERLEPASRNPWRPAWLALPFVPLVIYSAYQHLRTGDWLAWQHAQQAGWGRTLVWPWESLHTTWLQASADGQFAWAFRMEIGGAAVGLVTVVWLLAMRRWSELVYVGLQVGALMVSAYYLSIPRSALLWWPLWIAVARLGSRHRWVLVLYALVAGPLMVLNTAAFLKGAWAG